MKNTCFIKFLFFVYETKVDEEESGDNPYIKGFKSDLRLKYHQYQ